MTDRTFNFIRFLAEIGITALGTFYKVIAEIWELPYGEAVLATCVALSTLIGVFTEWQRTQYAKSKMILAPVEDASPILPEDTVSIKAEEIQ